jgi:conjugative transposon TraN protein
MRKTHIKYRRWSATSLAGVHSLKRKQIKFDSTNEKSIYHAVAAWSHWRFCNTSLAGTTPAIALMGTGQLKLSLFSCYSMLDLNTLIMHFINKLIIVITVGLPLALLLQEVDAQGTRETQVVEVAYNKTTSIVFPTTITSVDRGSRDLLAQKARGVGNVLQVKAARASFPETNLTVITSDGVIHQFGVTFTKQPSTLIVLVGDSSLEEVKPKLIFQSDVTEFEMKRITSSIIQSKRGVRFITDSNHKISMSLRNIFIKDDIIFYHFRIRNNSNINYDVDFLRFYIRDKTKVKRTASQDVDVVPVYTYGDDDVMAANSETDIVYALNKFTIPDAKYLAVEMFERNGGRHINLRINNRTIVNAQLIE